VLSVSAALSETAHSQSEHVLLDTILERTASLRELYHDANRISALDGEQGKQESA